MGLFVKRKYFLAALLLLFVLPLHAYEYPLLENSYRYLGINELHAALDSVPDEDIALVYYYIAEKYLTVNPDSCLFYLDLGEAISKTQYKQPLFTPFCLLKSTHSYIIGDMTEAFSSIMKALEFANVMHSDDELGLIYNHLGYLYRVTSNFDLALKSYSKAITYFDSKHIDLLDHCRIMMVSTFYDVQQYEAAVALLNTVEPSFKQQEISSKNNKFRSRIFQFYISSFHKMGEIALRDSCLAVFEEFSINCQASENSSSAVLCSLCDTYLTVDQHHKAISTCYSLFQFEDVISDSRYRATILTRLAHAQEHIGDYKGELASNQNALRLRLSVSDSTAYLNSLISVANSFLNLKVYDSVLRYLDVAYVHASREQMLLQIERCCSMYSRFSVCKGDYKSAFEWNKRAALLDKQKFNKGLSEHLSYHNFDYNIDLELEHIDELQSKNYRNQLLMIILVVVIILIVIIFYLVHQYRKNRIREDNVRLKQNLLTAQMNPHFIFNSLVAIQNYIYKEDTLEAVRYLGSFSNLIRQFLYNSRTDYMSLLHAIETTQHYVDLQSLRFSNSFDFSMNIDPSLQCETTHIPPGLIQPFIENSIEHGLPTDKRGQISLGIWKDQNKICIEILDNGIGISQSVKSKKSQSHQSLARVITEERFQLFNTQRGKKVYSFQTTDRVLADGSIVGTRVLLVLPLVTDQSEIDLDKSSV